MSVSLTRMPNRPDAVPVGLVPGELGGGGKTSMEWRARPACRTRHINSKAVLLTEQEALSRGPLHRDRLEGWGACSCRGLLAMALRPVLIQHVSPEMDAVRASLSTGATRQDTNHQYKSQCTLTRNT